MTSERRIEANRRNAIASTGPKTTAGKAVVARNAVKHGLLSRETLLPDEDGEALAALHVRLCAALKPVGEIEEFLVDRIVSCAWRLRRAHGVEVAVFEHWRRHFGDGDRGLGVAVINDSRKVNAFSKLSRYETTLERSFYRALHELQHLQAARAAAAARAHEPVELAIALSEAQPSQHAQSETADGQGR